MSDPNIEQLLNDGKGFNLNAGHVMEFLMARTIANSFLISEVLRRQIELEQLIQNGHTDKKAAAAECDAICKKIAENATHEKNTVIAELYFLNKDA